MRTRAAAASIIAAADPAIGSTLSPVFTALLPDAAAVVLFPLVPLFWLLPVSVDWDGFSVVPPAEAVICAIAAFRPSSAAVTSSSVA